MSITEFVARCHKNVKTPNSEIIERWNTRVVPQGLQARGRAGAADYLARYGKGISGKKVVALALMAEQAGAAEMAAGFWEKAYQLETGNSESYGAEGSGSVTAINAPTDRRVPAPIMPGLPAGFQPGMVATMQPTDAPRPQSSYILDPDYMGQPKRDGSRNVVFATPGGVAHQSRSTLVAPSFAKAFDQAARKAAAEIGPFVLDGEKLYLSAKGKEHRTAAQASTENIKLGKGTVRPVTKYSAFKALWFRGSLLEATEEERIAAGRTVVEAILRHDLGDVILESTPTAYTTGEKQALADKQKAEGREGEVWTLKRCAYTGGKGHKTDTVRTKYLIRQTAVITRVLASTAEGRPVAAFEVADENGKPLGKVGTGFDAATARKLAARHKADPGQVRVVVIAQGYSERGKLIHARLGGAEQAGLE